MVVSFSNKIQSSFLDSFKRIIFVYPTSMSIACKNAFLKNLTFRLFKYYGTEMLHNEKFKKKKGFVEISTNPLFRHGLNYFFAVGFLETDFFAVGLEGFLRTLSRGFFTVGLTTFFSLKALEISSATKVFIA